MVYPFVFFLLKSSLLPRVIRATVTPGPVRKAREECEDDKAWVGEGLCVPILDGEGKKRIFQARKWVVGERLGFFLAVSFVCVVRERRRRAWGGGRLTDDCCGNVR